MFKNKVERENILDGIVHELDYTWYQELEIKWWERILPDGHRILIEGRPYTLPKMPGFRDNEEKEWVYLYYLMPLHRTKFITDYRCAKSNIIDYMMHLKVDKDHEKLYKSYREYEEEQEEITITKTAAD